MRKNPFWLVLFLVSTDYVAENKIIYARKKRKKPHLSLSSVWIHKWIGVISSELITHDYLHHLKSPSWKPGPCILSNGCKDTCPLAGWRKDVSSADSPV